MTNQVLDAMESVHISQKKSKKTESDPQEIPLSSMMLTDFEGRRLVYDRNLDKKDGTFRIYC